MNSASDTNTALLVQLLDQVGDLRQEVGKINNQLEHGAKRFDEIDGQVVLIGGQMALAHTDHTKFKAELDTMAKAVGVIEPRVNTMEKFLGSKLAPIVAVSSTFIAVILWIITISIGAATAWIKSQFGDHFHWS